MIKKESQPIAIPDLSLFLYEVDVQIIIRTFAYRGGSKGKVQTGTQKLLVFDSRIKVSHVTPFKT